MQNVNTKQKTVFQELIEDSVNYNLWANETIINWLSTHPDEKLTEHVPSSFESILKTLEHIYKVQDFWFKMLQKQSYEFTEVEYTAQELFEKLKKSSGELRDFICQLDEFELEEKMEIVTPWFSSLQPRYELIQQIVTHTAYHRGQIVTIGRNIGITDASNTDFNFYLLTAKQKTM